MALNGLKPAYQVTYIGSCNEDWNCEISQHILECFAKIIKFPTKNKKGKVKILRDILLEVLDKTNLKGRASVSLNKGQELIFDKNTLDYSIPPIISTEQFTLEGGLRRPGGGATNCAYGTATQHSSMGSESKINLIVLEASKFCKEVFSSELPNVTIHPIRPGGKSFSNINIAVNLHGNGEREKLDFTTRESEFTDSDKAGLESILTSLSKDAPQMYVVNSIKDRIYSETVRTHIQKVRKTNSLKLVLAATGSMLKKNYDSTLELARESNIYVSNIEEFYELVRKSALPSWGKISSWEQLVSRRGIPNQKFLDGIAYLQSEQKKKISKKGRVYITCGELGAFAADGQENFYFQSTHPNAVSKAGYLNGAGDAFVSMMVSLESLSESSPIERILTMAVAGSQIAVKTPGANSPGMLADSVVGKEAAYCRGNLYKYDSQNSRFAVTRKKCI